MNSWNGIGRITANPELRYTSSEVAVCSFTLAVNRKFRNQNGDYEADFINIVAFKNLAETISKYVVKGDKLGVTGRIQTRNYENSEGKKVYVTEIIADSVDFLEPKKEPGKTEEDPYVNMGKQVAVDDDDLPF